jgi:WD40 repeat protein
MARDLGECWHAAMVRALVVSSDRRYVVSGSADRTVRVWTLP